MRELKVLVNEDVLTQAEAVLDNIGLDVEAAVRMLLKKISNEETIAFLLSDANVAKTVPAASAAPEGEGNLSKSLAKKKFIKSGYRVEDEVRYSKRNKASRNYWQNFDIDLFNEPLSIILNDQFNRKLYLFNIPAGAVDTGALQRRADKEDVVDLQIRGDDASFTDTKSGVSFGDFLVAEVGY